MSTLNRTIPRATYRLQLHAGFSLEDAAAVVDYLAELGVSHTYSSPILSATPGSTHGYDVVDHEKVNPELGGDAGLATFEQSLKQAGLGWVLDIVPNHMAIHTPANRAFWDVLEHGRASADAAMFDIDWKSPEEELTGRVMLPILGQPLEEVIAVGQFRVAIEDDKPVLVYYEHRMPLSPDSLDGADQATIDHVNASGEAMQALVDQQHYRPVFWRRACKEINYRRFFTINSLIGLRVEDPAVFDRVHALPLAWAKAGRLDGLRIDHPDGLRDPAGYLHRLRQAVPDGWLIIEKILEPDERLPADWPIDGTTGYDALNVLSGLFVETMARPKMTATYANSTGQDAAYERVAHDGKRFVMNEDFGGEIDRLVRLLETSGLEAKAARSALIELVVHWPVYRVYPDPQTRRLGDADAARVQTAVSDAAADAELDPTVWQTIERLLLLDTDEEHALDFAIRFQQLASAVTAKGVEDTAFYRYHRLVALNEVGGDPGRFGVPLERFHAYFSGLAHNHPGSMIATTTHDTKRSEDARMRIAMLSQMPDRWAKAVAEWSAITEQYCDADDGPTCGDKYLFFQTLVGAWPIEPDRLKAYMLKAAREAKTNTTWIDRDEEYEIALADFVEKAAADTRLIASLEAWLEELVPAARVASLSLTLVKLTLPGVPDIYQGCELWDESLVDPDNRRPVDFDRRRGLLKELGDGLSPSAILSRMEEGLPKLWVTRQALATRRDHPDCFGVGCAYEPIPAEGECRENVIAYRRGERAIVVAPRCTMDRDAWSDQTFVPLSAGHWRDAMSGRSFVARDGERFAVADLWQDFPVSLLIQEARR